MQDQSSSPPAELHERVAGHAMDGPLVHLDGTETLVEVDRAQVPVEHRPFEPTATALERRARQVPQQALRRNPGREISAARTDLRDRCRASPERSRSCGRTARSRRPRRRSARSRPRRWGVRRTAARAAAPRWPCTSWSRRSNSASSRISCRMMGASAGTAGLIRIVMAGIIACIVKIRSIYRLLAPLQRSIFLSCEL